MQNLNEARNSLEKKMRCNWAVGEKMEQYHDTEWGVPLHDDQKLFELLILEGMQAGLSWKTILEKRENFKQAFDHFNARIIADYSEKKIGELMQNSGIVRNRLKIKSAISNANAFLKIQKEYGSFDKFIWQFTNFKPIISSFEDWKKIPCSSRESDELSKALKSRGFNFVGTTICYSFMQAVGMLDDHTKYCFRKINV